MYCQKPDTRPIVPNSHPKRPGRKFRRPGWRRLVAGLAASSLAMAGAACGTDAATYSGRCQPLEASIGHKDVDIVGAWQGQGDEENRIFVFQPDGTWLLWLDQRPGMELREYGRFTARDEIITLSSPDGARKRAEAFSIENEQLRILIADGHPEPPTYRRASCEPWWTGPVD